MTPPSLGASQRSIRRHLLGGTVVAVTLLAVIGAWARTTELGGAVIASGVVKTLDDISTLYYLPNIAGVITSRALFGGAFTFREANAIASAPHEPTAPFL